MRHPRERFVFWSSVAANAAMVAVAAAIFYFGPAWLATHGAVSALVNRIRLALVAAVVLFPLLWVLRLGRWAAFRENAVRIGRAQIPELHAILERQCRLLGVELPELYVSALVKTGTSTALALSRGRRIIVLGPELFAGLNQLRDRADVLAFVLGQELGRLLLGHASWWEDLVLGYLKRVPLLRFPLLEVETASRDRFAMALAPEGFRGLVLTAVGGDLLDHVNIALLVRQILADDTPQSWQWIGDRVLEEPHFAKRVRHLHRDGYLHLERILAAELDAAPGRSREGAASDDRRPPPALH